MMAETIADFLIERFIEWGVAWIYGYPGDGINGITAALLRPEDPTISRRCGPLWSKRRGERTFCAKPGAVRNEERAVVKEISREELKAKLDRGDDFVLVAALSRLCTTRVATCRVRSTFRTSSSTTRSRCCPIRAPTSSSIRMNEEWESSRGRSRPPSRRSPRA